ncbi:terpene cyclase/mutase family protein [Tissierella pigra]|uniref:prenyltransferase/squalene oxidase repeat-containing protein n=1 Tax=Tissierella pigra TaxID=2607614 RepID=UPI001C1061D5|nr:prenyltransferase/squalene oxidase repeat-containing protein [Tissierella pigra]MBU5425920.1 terpene cyclase/mutase family protein [Tissierella pigra]
MKNKVKNLWRITFLIILSFSLISCTVTTSSTDYNIEEKIAETANFMQETVPDPTVSSIGGDWTIMSLARADIEIHKDYFENYYDNVVNILEENQGILHERKYTEYSRAILALTAIGKDPSDIAGYNLLEKLADYEKVIFQGINGPTFALLALDSKNYEIPLVPEVKIQATREMYIDNILERQLPDGGFSIAGDDAPADPDMTGMVLQALSKYKDIIKVKDAIDKAVECLSKLQLEDGGYESWGATNSESVVQVIMALTELGIDPNDSRFVKSEKTLIDNLMTFYVEGGGFMHIREGEKENGGAQAGLVDPMATDQGMYGIVAYQRYMNNMNSFYNMTDVN